MQKESPDFVRELYWIKRRSAPICGIDEAGRGPWAGPVVAAAVILDVGRMPIGLDDLKQLSAATRERLFEELTATAIVGVGIADVERIDRDNILAATLWAMATAVRALPVVPALALVDGNRPPELRCRTEMIVGGDGRSLSIAAASIIAKVTRDRLMVELAANYPQYGFERHKGYGTTAHAEALTRFGPAPCHRRSFKPVQVAASGDRSPSPCGSIAFSRGRRFPKGG